MNTIALYPDGHLVHGGRKVAGDPLSLLGFEVLLESGCTLRSFFRMLERYPVLGQLNPFGATFVTDYDRASDQDCRVDGISRLELSRTIEMTGYPGVPGMRIFVSLAGRCGEEICDIKSFWLDQLLDLPLELGRLRHLVFGDRLDRFDFETSFTLFELIDGICWQLSFHNLPKQCRVEF